MGAMRYLAVWSVLSPVGLALTLYYALSRHTYFFPSMVYLYNSKFCTLVLGNFGLWILFTVARVVIKLFLGQLRPQELELLSDNIKPTIMSLLFFLTIFRTQFNAAFFAGIVCLLFSKAAHWVVESRVQFMEQSPADSRWTYWRLGAMIGIMFWADAW